VNNIPDTCDFASIMYIPLMSNFSCNKMWCKIKYNFSGLQMYYLSPNGAHILLKQALPVVTHVDVYVGYVAVTEPNFEALRWGQHIYTISAFLRDHAYSTLKHRIQIRKILPHGNSFYVGVVVVFVVVLVWAIVATSQIRRRV
jgi:hypothetical protein